MKVSNQTTQDCSNSPTNPAGNSFASLQIFDSNNDFNVQHTNTATLVPQNITFEFYFPYDARIIFLKKYYLHVIKK